MSALARGPALLPAPSSAGAGLAQLIQLYARAEANLEQTIRAAALRGAKGTSQYSRLQLLRVQAELQRLQHMAVPLAQQTIASGYLSAASAVDVAIGLELAPWHGIDQHAMNRLADSLAVPLRRMSMTVGRQAADAYRKTGLLETGIGIASGRPGRATAHAIASNLSRQGITGFVDKSGRRWRMGAYANMVARTTTREAISQGTGDRMAAHGLDLVTISEHGTEDELCAEYEGNTYSLSGDTPGYDVLDDSPPFHPNCEHVMYPAEVEFTDWLSAWSGEADNGVLSPDLQAGSADAAQTAAAQAEAEVAGGRAISVPRIPEAAPAAARIKLTGNLLGQVKTPEHLDALFHQGDPLGQLGWHLGDAATARRIPRAQALVQDRTQKSLVDRGLPERLKVYTDPTDRGPGGGLAHVSLNDFQGATPMTIDRSQVLADVGRIFPGQAEDGDLLVKSLDLHPVGERPTPPIEPPAAKPEPPAGGGELSKELLDTIAREHEAPGLVTNDVVKQIGGRLADTIRFSPRVKAAQSELTAAEQKLEDLRAEGDRLFRTLAMLPEWRGRSFWEWPPIKENDLAKGQAQSAMLDARRRLQIVRQEETKRVMGQVREMGGEPFKMQQDKSSLALGRKLRDKAIPYLPKDWIERSNLNGRITGIGTKRGQRAYQQTEGYLPNTPMYGATIALSAREADSVVLHEISHRMEYVVPELMRLENDYLADRLGVPHTGTRYLGERLKRMSEITGSKAYGPREVGVEAGFAEGYMGKIYERSLPVASRDHPGYMLNEGVTRPSAGELFTTGQEGVWYGRYNLWEKDPGMAEWVLGLLALL